CGGSWVHAQHYWDWLERQKSGSPTSRSDEPASSNIGESGLARRCPECGHFLAHAKVGHGLAFHIDRCTTCGGMWFNAGEWQTLRDRGLHTQVHFVFSAAWQAKLLREELSAAREQILRDRLGDGDLNEVKRIKQWIDSHPHRVELYAYLVPEAERR